MGYLFDALNRAEKGEAPGSRPVANTQAGIPGQQAQPGPGLSQQDLQPPPPDPANHSTSFQAIGFQSCDNSFYLQNNTHEVDDRLVAMTEPSSLMAEEYRAMRTGMLARWQNKRHLVHTITSATPREGKTITSLNLGLSFSELKNRRTLVVEADLRLPQFAKLLKLPPSPGLMGVLTDGVDPSKVIQCVGDGPLHVIPAGSIASNESVQVLSTPAMTSLINNLRQRYDHVIFDTPPVVELADAGILASLSDDVMLVVRMGKTPRALVEQALRNLSGYNATVAGVIATDQQPYYSRYFRYGFGYHYRYQYGSQIKQQTPIKKAA